MVQEWVRNPILWASVLGGAAYAKGWVLPEPLGETVALVERLVVLVALACPTAVASYTMAGVMGGDEAMAAQTVVGSTVASAGVLALILALAG